MEIVANNLGTALVTGSSSGIGAAIARRLGRAGYHVYVTYHTSQVRGEATASAIRETGGSATALHLDVTSAESVADSMEKVRRDFGRLNVLVYSAVTEVAKDIESATFAEWKLVVGTKIDGAFLCTKMALPLMRGANNAHLIFITSRDGEKPDPGYLAYCVGSAGLIAFVKAMALYLPHHGIRVNAVTPGPVRTPLWDALGGKDEAMWVSFAKASPMGRVATVDDVAGIVQLIVDEPTHYLNGNFIYVGGGGHLR